MLRIAACALIQCLMPICAGAASPSNGGQAYTFTDLSGDYTRFFDRTAPLQERDRVAAFKADFVPLFPAFYGKTRYPQQTQERFDARIAKSLAGFAVIRERYTQTAQAFQTMLDPALEAFQHRFPDLRALPPVYLLHSLGEMDGGTRMFDGKLLLIFGADVMAKVHDFSDERPFLHHELFHVYHQQFFPDCEEIWCGLWTEGLAVYAAQQLNPQSSDSQLLLTQPEPLRAQIDARLRDSVCAVSERLASKSESDWEALFSFKRLNAAMPPRAGYYIGYLTARQAGKTRSLSDLAHLSQGEARAIVEQALAALASCH